MHPDGQVVADWLSCLAVYESGGELQPPTAHEEQTGGKVFNAVGQKDFKSFSFIYFIHVSISISIRISCLGLVKQGETLIDAHSYVRFVSLPVHSF